MLNICSHRHRSGSRTLRPQDTSAPRHFGTTKLVPNFKTNHRWSCLIGIVLGRSVPAFPQSRHSCLIPRFWCRSVLRSVPKCPRVSWCRSVLWPKCPVTVGAQSTLCGGKTFLPENLVWKINKIPEFYMAFAPQMPKFYMIIAWKISRCFWGRGHMTLAPSPSLPRLLCLSVLNFMKIRLELWNWEMTTSNMNQRTNQQTDKITIPGGRLIINKLHHP